jgi:malonyl-CoA decarboxylase
VASLVEHCRQLLTHRGRVSGLALAQEIISTYEQLSAPDRAEFFGILSKDFAIKTEDVLAAAERYRQHHTLETVTELRKSLDAPFKRLFRRLNSVPGGTMASVRIREHLLALVSDHPELAWLEHDLKQLLIEWFNRGFLVLDRIDWDSPARVLEKVIKYEAVHEINGWDDLHNRLRRDRRCFAFFHLAIPDDPLILLEVALTNGLPSSVGQLLAPDREVLDQSSVDTATFYSISSCHKGLQGISLGEFLIKQVVELLRQELENIRSFATLSPLPGFRKWLETAHVDELPAARKSDVGLARERLADAGALPPHELGDGEAEHALVRLAAYYLTEVKRADRMPADSVARFHLANGASIERLCWAADVTPTGISRSWGIMVNYAYDPREIEQNHENYYRSYEIAMSSSVRKLVNNQ